MSAQYDNRPPYGSALRIVIAISIVSLILDVTVTGGQTISPLFDTPQLTVETFWNWVLGVGKVASLLLFAGGIVALFIQAARLSCQFAVRLVNR